MAAAVIVVFVAEVVRVLLATGGHFTYTLDDPYIHLALAEQIRHGHYGINPGEPASPSSSMLWPFLLSLTAGTPFQDWMPLIWNLLFTTVSALLIHDSFAAHLRRGALLAATAGSVLALNIVGVAFTGLEHSLQILLTLVVARGVVKVVRHRELDRLMPLAMALGPLIRYENISFSIGAAVVLAVTGRRRVAVLATLAWVTALSAFSWFLVSHGLDPLPSSVLAKSPYAAVTSLERLVKWRASLLVMHPVFVVCFLTVLMDAVVLRRRTVLHSFVAFVLACHAVAGDFGWQGRYEVYLLAGVLPVLVTLLADWAGVWSRAVQVGSATLAALALLSVGSLVSCTLRVPAASAFIWHEQAQTARFVHDFWRQPIAVNDLGLVAYRGGQPVLDLWGLGSQEARRLRLEDRGRWLGPLVRSHGVRAAVVYSSWFEGQVPPDWTKVGTLAAASVPNSPEVVTTYYATSRAATSEVCQAFRRFAAQDADGHLRVSDACLR